MDWLMIVVIFFSILIGAAIASPIAYLLGRRAMWRECEPYVPELDETQVFITEAIQ